jgi:hypothetical protein
MTLPPSSRPACGVLISDTCSGQSTFSGAFEIYPASEANFFIKLNSVQLTLLKNAQGVATGFIHHSPEPGVPDVIAKKLRD